MLSFFMQNYASEVNEMDIVEARAEYSSALKKGKSEYRERLIKGLDPCPAVLEDQLDELTLAGAFYIGTADVPIERIVGTVTGARTNAFSASFYPILEQDTEFAAKWISLAASHLAEGIRDSISCVEYLGDLYVQEGNKRVSVLRHFGAATVSAKISRVMPAMSEEPRIKAYREFIDFYNVSGLYLIKYEKPGQYAKLLACLGKKPGEKWTDDFRRSFISLFSRFESAYSGKSRPEEALLTWLEAHTFKELSELGSDALKKTFSALTSDMEAEAKSVSAVPPEAKKRLIESIIRPDMSHVTVAFVHQHDRVNSRWTESHDNGRKYVEELFGSRLTANSYFNADTADEGERLMELAVTEGADAVFVTSANLLRPALKVAVKYPKVKFFVCSPDVPYASVRGYYFRGYEGKFITGAIAGALARDGRIGYVAYAPLVGEPAMVNAFALGAEMTNPGAKIILRWAGVHGGCADELVAEGVSVISNHDVPSLENDYMNYGHYGSFLYEDGRHSTLASPCWLWGTFYEQAVRAILTGSIDSVKGSKDAVNFLLGMDTGVIDVTLGSALPEGVKYLAEHLKRSIAAKELDIFRRRIVGQDGGLISDGSKVFTAEELMHMDKLISSVDGAIPAFEELSPSAQSLVRLIGVHKEDVPPEIEVK